MFRLPPAMQQPGTWHIDQPPLDSHYSASGADRGGALSCPYEAGGFTYGDVTVVEISERTLVVRLDYVRTFDLDFSGTYTVDRCP
jgi:hypothetical protein